MPSPLGHAMAGAMTAWLAEARSRPSPDPQIAPRSAAAARAGREPRWLSGLSDLASPLAATCAALAVLPDFDVFLHTHRTYSHSIGAAAIVWLLGALVAWRFHLPVVRTATVCAAAYASHVLLDWLGRDASRLPGPMALWPLTTLHFKSGLDLFMEFTLLHRRRFNLAAVLLRNAPALGRELLILGPPFLVAMTLRLWRGREATLPDARPERRARGLGAAPAVPEERG